jgi:transposase
MMRALEPEVHDAVFEAIQGLLPEPPMHPLGCHRPRISDRICFQGLLIRIVTGSAWETVEFLMGYTVSDTTLRARRNEWIAAGVFDRLLEEALAAYDRIIGLDSTHVTIDGSEHTAACGGQGTAAGPKTHGRLGWKWCAGVDADGIPIGWVIDGANRQDYRLLQPVLDQITAQPATAQIGTLHLDRGFGYKSLPDKLDGYPINNVNVIPRNQPGQGRIPLVGFGRRWVAERTHSWFTNYGQLAHNTDRRTEHRHAALCLATVFLITARLIDLRQTNYRPIR